MLSPLVLTCEREEASRRVSKHTSSAGLHRAAYHRNDRSSARLINHAADLEANAAESACDCGVKDVVITRVPFCRGCWGRGWHQGHSGSRRTISHRSRHSKATPQHVSQLLLTPSLAHRVRALEQLARMVVGEGAMRHEALQPHLLLDGEAQHRAAGRARPLGLAAQHLAIVPPVSGCGGQDYRPWCWCWCWHGCCSLPSMQTRRQRRVHYSTLLSLFFHTFAHAHAECTVCVPSSCLPAHASRRGAGRLALLLYAVCFADDTRKAQPEHWRCVLHTSKPCSLALA